MSTQRRWTIRRVLFLAITTIAVVIVSPFLLAMGVLFVLYVAMTYASYAIGVTLFDEKETYAEYLERLP